MDDFTRYLNQQLDNPEFKKEWDALQPGRDMVKAMIKARTDAGLTQKELASKTGVQQSNISRIEQGTYNPSVKLLQRLAQGMGKELHIEFV
jgi:predicted transcriptional regulator